MPTFCFICGKMGHAEKYCPQQFDINEETFVKPYGPELRAMGRRSQPQSCRWLLPHFPSHPANADYFRWYHCMQTKQTILEDGRRHEVEHGQITQSANTGQSHSSRSLNALSESINVHMDENLSTIYPSTSLCYGHLGWGSETEERNP